MPANLGRSVYIHLYHYNPKKFTRNAVFVPSGINPRPIRYWTYSEIANRAKVFKWTVVLSLSDHSVTFLEDPKHEVFYLDTKSEQVPFQQ